MQTKFSYILLGVLLAAAVAAGSLAWWARPSQAEPARDVVQLDPQPSPTAVDVEAASEAPTQTAVPAPTVLAQPIAMATAVERVEVEPDLSSAEEPQTDIDAIQEQIELLADRYEAELNGREGWFYQATEHYSPVEFHSNTGEIGGVPLEELYPDDVLVRHMWRLLEPNHNLQYRELVGYAVGPDGGTYGRVAQTMGKWMSLELVAQDPSVVSDRPEPTSLAYRDFLFMVLNVMRDPERGWVQAWEANGLYHFEYYSWYEAPKVFDNIGPDPVVASKNYYVFDMETGFIKENVSMVHRQTDGELIVIEHILYLESDFVDLLPQKAAEIMSQAQQIIANVK